MKRELHFSAIVPSFVLPIVAAELAIAIFVLDTVTDLEIAVAVFYVAVVLMSVSFCRKRGVLLVSLGCMGLTVLSYVLTPSGSRHAGLVNGMISLSAIAATTYLALKIQSAEVAIHEARAQLAHIARVTTLGELTASLAHEINQALAAVVASGERLLAVARRTASQSGKGGASCRANRQGCQPGKRSDRTGPQPCKAGASAEGLAERQ